VVVRIKTGKSIRGALSYNEHKVHQGKAELILASQFSRDITELGFTQKMIVFEKLNVLNPKSKVNTMHLSLNFAPGELLDDEKLQTLAMEYIERIGFGNQPYLVYKHQDASHPHLHIVTTTIQANGKAIYLHNIGKRKSEPARKAIEQEYNLVKAEGREQQKKLPLKPVELKVAWYGQSETKNTISNIVREIVANYKYTSLEELNAVLRQYNVIADRGSIHSNMYKKRGLVYSIVDKDGYKVGIPVKASAIYTSPTLSVIEKKFERNLAGKHIAKKYLQNKIGYLLAKNNSPSTFLQALKEKNISSSIYYNEKGGIENIHFIDHSNRSVFSCQDIGFTVHSIVKQLNNPATSKSKIESSDSVTAIQPNNDFDHFKFTNSFQVIKDLLAPEYDQQTLSAEFFKKRRKKRKR